MCPAWALGTWHWIAYPGTSWHQLIEVQVWSKLGGHSVRTGADVWPVLASAPQWDEATRVLKGTCGAALGLLTQCRAAESLRLRASEDSIMLIFLSKPTFHVLRPFKCLCFEMCCEGLWERALHMLLPLGVTGRTVPRVVGSVLSVCFPGPLFPLVPDLG